MKIHALKIERKYLLALRSGDKKVEIRRNDRNYETGDTLVFTDSADDKRYEFTITHITSEIGMRKDYVALSVERNKS